MFSLKMLLVLKHLSITIAVSSEFVIQLRCGCEMKWKGAQGYVYHTELG